MYTKLITLDDNPLDKCGSTIKDIITYLSQFPEDAELSAYLVGYTQEAYIESSITIKANS